MKNFFSHVLETRINMPGFTKSKFLWLPLLLFAGISINLTAQVTVDGTQTFTSATTGNSLSVSHPVGASATLLVVGISTKDELVSSVTIGGAPLTLVGSQTTSSNAKTFIYKQNSPSPGTANVIVNFSGTISKGAVMGVMTFNEASIVKPLDYTSGTDNSSNASLNIPSSNGDILFNVVSVFHRDLLPSAGQSVRWNINTSSDVTGAAGTVLGAISATLVDWVLDGSSEPWSMSGISVKPLTASDVKITKSVNNATPLLGDNIVFTLTASNSGPDNTTEVNVNDKLPTGFSYISHTATTGTYDNVTGIWSIGNFNVLASSTLSITAKVECSPDYLNIATITAKQSDPDVSNNTATVFVKPLNSISTTYNLCPGSDFNLTSLNPCNIPAGTNVTWHTGTPASSSNKVVTPSAVGAGTYYVAFEDAANSCYSQTTAFTISLYPAITANASAGAILCYGGTTVLMVTASGGAAPFQYSLNGGAYQSSNTFAVSAGTHTVTVTDANNCTKATAPVTVTQPSALGSTLVSKTDVTGYNQNTGTITITGNGSTAPYSYSLDNSDFSNTTGTFNNLPAGTYTIYVMDKGNCGSVNRNVTITQPSAALSFVTNFPNITQPTCFGGGTIEPEVTGGMPPYTYDWSDIPGNDDPKERTGLLPGTYRVEVKDFNGNSILSDNLVLNTPTACAGKIVCRTETASVFSVDPDPANTTYTWTVPAGAIIVSGQGTPSLVINWNGVEPGSYEVCVTASGICGAVDPVCIPTHVNSANAVVSAGPVCEGGDLHLYASGGLTYHWTGPNGFTSSSPNPVIYDATLANSGNYTVIVTEAGGCIDWAIQNVTVHQKPELTIETVTGANCGQSDGAIDISTSLGTAPYTLLWNSGATTEDLSNIYSGNYTVTATDYNGCTVTSTIPLSNIGAPTVTATGNNIKCTGGTGSIALAVLPDPGSYTFAWSTRNGSGLVQGQQDQAGLSAGTYNVIVTDACGCQGTATVTITEPDPLTLDKTQVNNTCFGDNSGVIDLIVTGGKTPPPYFYEWNTADGTGLVPGQEDQTGLTAGTYSVTVTDGNDCVNSLSVVITQPEVLSATLASANLTCNGANDGTIIITSPAGGSGTYEYSIDGGISWQTNGVFTGRASGNYNIQIRDRDYPACTKILDADFNITQPEVLLATVSSTNITCNGANNGTITISNPTGGSSTFEYSINGGGSWEADGNYTDLVNATYNILIRDKVNPGCIIILNGALEITQPGVLSANLTSSDITCYGANNGKITIDNPTGGYTNYEYSIDAGVNWQSAKTFTDLMPGTYNVLMRDADHVTCFRLLNSITIIEPQMIALSAVVSNLLCNGAATGEIDITASGGTGMLTYLWTTSGGTGLVVAQPDQTGLTAGIYNLKVTDANGCYSERAFTISQPTPLALTMINSDISCNGEINGSINLSVSGGISPYSYAWSNLATSEDIAGLTVGTYTATVTDANNCIAALTSPLIQQPDLLIPGASVINDVTCKGGSDGSATVNPSGGTSPYSYLWSNGSTDQTPANFAAGTYTVNVTDARGCTANASVIINEPSVSIELITTTIDASSCGGNTGLIDLIVTNGSPTFHYLWTGPTVIGDIEDPTDLAVGTYGVTVTDNLGCSTDLSEILVNKAPALVVSVEVEDRTCQAADGSVNTLVSGGVGPFTYNWSPGGATTSFLSGLDAGTYTVTVKDANNCEVSATGDVNIPSCGPPVAVDDNFNSCAGASVSNSVATNDSDPESALLEYLPLDFPDASQGTINWDSSYNGAFIFEPKAGYNGAVVIRYQVSDPTNLVATGTLTINVSSMSAQVTAGNTIHELCGSANGSATVSFTGGFAPYSYLWNTSPAQTLATASNLATGNYTVRVTDSKGCFADAGVTIQNRCLNLIKTQTGGLNPVTASGQVLTYSVVITNTGTLDISEVVPTEIFPGTGANTFTGPAENISANGILNIGETWTYTATYSVTSVDVHAGPDLVNTISIITAQIPGPTIATAITPVDDSPVAVDDAITTNEDTPISSTVTANDTPSGDGGNAWSLDGINGGAAHGTVTMDPDGSYTYTPVADYFGTDIFTYRLCDGSTPPDCSVASVSVTITSVNDTPAAQNDVITTNEDLPVTGDASVNDTPSGDGGNVWSLDGINGGAAHGTVTMDPDGSYTYTPVADYFGPDAFTYRLCDGSTPSDCSVASVSVTITSVNDTPAAQNDVITTNEDLPVTGDASVNDTPSGDGGNIWSLDGTNGGAAHGTVTMDPDGSYTYTPVADYFGSDLFTYRLCDGSTPPDCSVATVSVTITSVNDVPVAVNDGAITNEDTQVSGNASVNDTPSGDGGNIWSLDGANGGAAHGTVTMDPDGSYTYTPVADYFGPDAFTYRLCDGSTPADCSVATVSVTITSVDDTPAAQNDVITTNEDLPVTGNASVNDTPSGDGGNLWSLVGVNGGAAHGTVTMDPDGSYTYTPVADYFGVDVFSYRLCDGSTPQDCSVATVSVTITSVNDTPAAQNDVINTSEDIPVTGNASVNDTPSGDGGNLWSLVGINGGAAHGTVTIDPDGSYTYTPVLDYFGPDVFTYRLCDGSTPADCSVATVSVTITSVNDVPVAVNDGAITNEDAQVSGNASVNDTPSGDGGNAWILDGINGGAAHGTVTMDPDGSYTYTPVADYFGPDVFTYRVCDGSTPPDCSVATVSVTITSVNDVPVAVNDGAITNEDTPVTGNASVNDTPSGDGGNVWSLDGSNGGATHGTVTMDPDGSYTYTPVADYFGVDVFSYRLCDGSTPQDCSVATVSVTITSVNDTPAAQNDVITTSEDIPVTGNASVNDTPSGDGGNVWSLDGINGGAAHGTVTMDPDGSYTYTPVLDYFGPDVFTYRLCDGSTPADCSVATVSVTITSVNDTPAAQNDVITTSEDIPVTGNASVNDTPSGDGGNAWSLDGINGGAAHGTVTMDPDGSYTYTPVADYFGSDVFTYRLCDGSTPADCSVATVSVTINSVNDTPAAQNDVITTSEDSPISSTVTANDTPSGDGGNAWSLDGINGGAAHGTVTMDPDGSYTYTPVADYFGSDAFTYRLCDGSTPADCSVATVSVTITSVNDTPAAQNDVITTNEDLPVTGDASVNDTPSGDGGNVWSLDGIDGGAVHGTVTMDPDGSYTYTPVADYFGSDVFSYRLCDGSTPADCSVATVSVTITSVNDIPVAQNDLLTTNEDLPVTGFASINDTPSGDGGNVWCLDGANGGAAHGTVTMNPDGSYTYTPVADYFGPDAFTYRLCDGSTPSDCSVASVSVTITSVNDTPAAQNDVINTSEDIPVTGFASINDTPSGDGGNLWSLVGVNGGAAHGTVTMDPDGSYTYTPVADYFGVDVFSYRLCDGSTPQDCSVATVSVTITSVNDTPAAQNDVITTNEDLPVTGNVSINDTPSGDGGNAWSLDGTNGGAAHGTVTIDPDGSYTYTPVTDYFGSDVFTYRLCDGSTPADCSVATVSVTITSVNDVPVAVNDNAITNEDTQVSGNVSTNDTPSGDGGNVWSLDGANGGAAHGTVTMDPDGSYTYTPVADYFGPDAFTYRLCDGSTPPDCSVASVSVTITSVNDTPAAQNDVITTSEDSPISSTVTANDTPSGDGGNVWSLDGSNGGATHGTVTMDPDGSYTYTPVADYFGVDVFSYRLCDGSTPQDCSVATVSVTITSVNDTPAAQNDVITTSEDSPISSTVTANDTPSGDGGNAWSLDGINGGAAHGTVTMDPDGSYTYTPVADYFGPDAFTYRLCDGSTPPDCSVATVSVTITSVNDVPVAVNDGAITNEDTQVSGNASVNDTPSGDGGNIWSLDGTNGGAAHGTVTMDPDGSYTYTPVADYFGPDAFMYRLCDGSTPPDCSVATVSVTITSVNDTPAAQNDVITTSEDIPVTGNASVNDTPSGDGGNAWSLDGINGGATHGTVTMDPDGSYTYTPVADYFGVDVFSYRLCDGSTPQDCSVATVSVTITSVNDTPAAQNDVITTSEDSPISSTVTANDTPSGDGGNAWSLDGINGGAAHGTVTMDPDGSYTYTPVADYFGVDVFSYRLCDGSTPQDCSVATVSVTITSVNDTPAAQNDVITTNEDLPVTGNVSINDTPSGDGGNAWSLDGTNGGAAHGTVTMDPDGSYTYTPVADYFGPDAFTYRLCDGSRPSDCSVASVSVTITSVNDTPAAQNDVITTNEDLPVTGNVSINDTPSGDGGNAWSLDGTNGGAAHGTVTMNPDGSYTYTPVADYFGVDVFSYRLCDGSTPQDCSVATVSVTITSVNDTPAAQNDVITTSEDIPVTGFASVNDTPSGDGGNIWSLDGTNGGAAHGTVTMDPDGSYTYTPVADYFGSDVFTYRLCDGSTPADCSVATVSVTITSVNDIPAAQNDLITTSEDLPVTGFASVNDTPSGDGGNIWSLDGTNGGAAHGTVMMDPDGSYTYTPVADYFGSDLFTYRLCDGSTPPDCSVATVSVTITSVNDVPVAVNDGAITNEDTQVSGNASVNDTPSGDGGNAWSLDGSCGGAAHGTVTMDPDGSYTYSPVADYFGSDVISYRVCDGSTPADCSAATVTITINQVNDIPYAVNDTTFTIEDTPVSGNVSANDNPSSDGGNVWSLVGVNGGAVHGTVMMDPDGHGTYIPDTNYFGSDVFTYRVCDGSTSQDCSVGTVFVTISPVNDLPLAVNDFNSTNEDTPVSGNVSINDTPSGDGGNVWSLIGITGGTNHGSVTMNPVGSYIYTPAADYVGTDVFSYRLTDGSTPRDISAATVTITISQVNDIPYAVNDTTVTNEDTPVSGNVSANDNLSGDGGNIWSLVGVNGGAAHGTVMMDPDGYGTYTPDKNYFGSDVFTYRVCDGSTPQDCSMATVTVTIASVNDLPLAVNDINTISEGAPVSGNAASNDISSNDGGNVWSIVGINGGAAHGTVTMDHGGSYTYTPVANYLGSDEFSYQLCDGSSPADCATATVTILGAPGTVDDASNGIITGAPVTLNVTENDVTGNLVLPATVSCIGGTDTDGNGTLDKLIVADQGIWSVNPVTGAITFTPVAGYSGNPTPIFYTVKDIDGATSKSASVTITFACVPPLVPSATLIQPTCAVPTGTITVTSPVGETLEYSKDGSIWGSAKTFSGLAPNATYTIRVRNTASDPGCVSSAEFIINPVSGAPAVPLISGTITQPTCALATGSILISGLPASGTWTLTGSAGGSTTGTGTSTTLQGLITGTYTYTVTNAEGCTSPASANVIINEQPITPLKPVIEQVLQPTCTETTGTITVIPQVGTGLTYLLDGSTYSDMNNTGIFTLLPSEDYTVTVRSQSGCVSQGTSVTINPKPTNCADSCVVFVPNSFSPNADGINDNFIIRCLDNYENPVIEIYNRWGNLVFKKDHYGNVDFWGSENEAWWDGHSDNKLTIGNQMLPVGTYFYVLKLDNASVLTGFLFLNK